MKTKCISRHASKGTLLGIGILLGATINAQAQAYLSLYTNVTADGSLTLPQAVSVDSGLLNTNVAGIVFEGNGTIQGPGGISVQNIATTGNPGSYEVAGIVGGTITNLGLGAVNVSNDQSAYNGTNDSYAVATGIDASLVGDLGGAVSVSAKSGTTTVAGGSAFAGAGAYGVYEVDGSINAAIFVSAMGGTAIGDYADAEAEAYGSDFVSSNLVSTISATAVGGTASSIASNAHAGSYVGGIDELGGDLRGSITSSGTGGTASSVDGVADASAYSYGAGGISGNVSGTITVTANGGKANSASNSAYADAYAYGVSSDIGGDVSGTGNIRATATSGTAISSNGTAYVNTEAYGIYESSIDGDFAGTVIATATGGDAASMNGDAYSTIKAHGISYGVGSNMTGTVNVQLVAGTVTANGGDAEIKLRAKGIGYDGVGGKLSGTLTVYAEGGTATATDDAEIDMKVIGVDYDIDGDMSGTISVTSVGGTAYGASADTTTRGHGVRSSGGGGDILGDLSGAMTVDVTGGTITATNGSAYNDSYARGVTGGIHGGITGTGTITVTARGGSTIATNGFAYSYANAYGVVYDTVVSNVAGRVTAYAQGGTANADNGSANAKSYSTAIYYGVDGDVVAGAVISAEARGGTAVSSNDSADASADADAVDDAILGSVAGTISATSYGGTASGNYANAGAEAYGAYYIGSNVTGTITAYALGGNATASNSSAYADAYAEGTDDSIDGDVSGTITAQAVSGSATGSSNSSVYTYAEAYGVDGSIGGTFSGVVNATATATAASGGDADAFAGAYGVFGDVDGEMSGQVSAIATAGTAQAADGSAYGNAEAYGIAGDVGDGLTGSVVANAYAASANSVTNGDANSGAIAVGVEGVYGGMSGNVVVNAISADATAEDGAADARAIAIGADGGFEGYFSGRIDAIAIAGNAQGTSIPVEDGTLALGIVGDTVVISNFSGTIMASATAGLNISGGTTNLSMVRAGGIVADDQMYLNASNGTIHAQILAPNGLDHSTNSVAASIWGGTGDDTVMLSQMSLMGDINLNKGSNTLSILGDTRFDGRLIHANGGLFGFNIENGQLTLAGDTRVEDLIGGEMNVSSNGGLGFELYGSASDPRNGKLTVDGVMNVETGATIAASSIVSGGFGEQYIVVQTASNGLSGAFVENPNSVLIIDVTNTLDRVIITPTGLRYQQNGVAANAQAAVGSVGAVINNLSKQAGGSRQLARGSSGTESAVASTPAGAAGPGSDAREKRLKSGDWVMYVRQFNDLGGVDSDGTVSGYDWSTHGLLLGAEKMLGENMLLGATVGGSWMNLDGENNSGSGDSEMGIAAIYADWFTQQWYVDVGASLGMSGNDTTRIDTMGNSYQGNYDSSLFGTWIEGGYGFPMSKAASVEPYGRLAYVSGVHDGYTESGTPAPMTVSGNNTDNLVSELGLRGANNWTFSNGGIFRLGLLAGWRYEHLDNTISVNTSILGINQQSSTPEADRSAFVLGVKGDWYINDVWAIGLEYEPTFSGNWQNHAINGVVSYKF